MQGNENHVDLFCQNSVQQNISVTLRYIEKIQF